MLWCELAGNPSESEAVKGGLGIVPIVFLSAVVTGGFFLAIYPALDLQQLDCSFRLCDARDKGSPRAGRVVWGNRGSGRAGRPRNLWRSGSDKSGSVVIKVAPGSDQ